MDFYGTARLKAVKSSPLQLTMPHCEAVEGLRAVSGRGTPLRIDVGDVQFQGRRRARYHKEDSPGENRAENHFQGVARYGRLLFITGADWDEPAAHLFICELELDDGGAAIGGQLASVYALDTTLPHAGGTQRLGDVLIIVLEGGNEDSRVRFLQMRNDKPPSFLGGLSEIVRVGQPKASAGALTLLSSNRLLIGVTWKSALDLYVTRTADPRKGYVNVNSRPAVRTLDLSEQLGDTAYQAIAFLPPEEWTRVDGGSHEIRVPVLGFRNEMQSVSNWWRGDDVADLFVLIIPGEAIDRWPEGPSISIRPIETKRFTFGRFDGNFSAASGLDIRDDGSLDIYAVHHWRTSDGIRLSLCANS